MQPVELDDKYAQRLSEELEAANLPVRITRVERRLEPTRLKLWVAIADETDWELRYRVQDVADRFAEDWTLEVLTFFYGVDAEAAV